ncbi:MAG: tetratricopeptide repeat protein [Candidatus Cloacimonetes bacterium]|nr:tetratricopeptide repeat protein [Candidatus Cloacimonadota bacterium]
MKRILFLALFILSCSVCLYAVPKPLYMLPDARESKAVFKPLLIHLDDSHLYIYCQTTKNIKIWDLQNRKFKDITFIGWNPKTKPSSITSDDKQLYILDSATKSILVYLKNGEFSHKIQPSGAAEASFKKAISLVVNQMGYLYVLDTGRKEILSFTNEGMFRSSIPIEKGIALTIGQDQKLRLLQTVEKRYQLCVYDQNLKPEGSAYINHVDPVRDKLVDIGISSHGEILLLNNKPDRKKETAIITMINDKGDEIPESKFGSQGTRLYAGRFANPIQLQVFNHPNLTRFAILDPKHPVIQLFEEDQYHLPQVLATPALGIRPFISDSSELGFVDFVNADTLQYYIYDGIANKGKFPSNMRHIVCKGASGKVLFSIDAKNLKREKVKSFNALAVYSNRLYVVDTPGNCIYIFDGLTGEFISSFGEKGSRSGELNSPTSIAIQPNGLVYVADNKNKRIVIWLESGMFRENIDLKSDLTGPKELKICSDSLYVLMGNTSIYAHSLSNPKQRKLLVNGANIVSFDLLFDGRIGYVEKQKQNLHVYHGNVLENKYLSINSKGVFPYFANISAIRYIPGKNQLLISDSKLNKTRYLDFFYPPSQVQNIQSLVNNDRRFELRWTPNAGIREWTIYELAGNDTIYHSVNEPRFVVHTPQKSAISYQIATFSEDRKRGPLSEEIIDDYSYARFLHQSGNYLLAMSHFQKAFAKMPSEIIATDMANCYMDEAMYYTRQQEYEKALLILNAARRYSNDQGSILAEEINIYKISGAYADGIKHLQAQKDQNNAFNQKQLITLYYLNKEYLSLINLAKSFLGNNPGDVEVLEYLADSYEVTNRYQEALDAFRSLMAFEPSFYTQLRIASILIELKQYDDAIKQLERMETTYPHEPLDKVSALMGTAYRGKGMYDRAVHHLENALATKSEDAEYNFLIATVYQEFRKPNDAERYFLKAHKLSPQDFTIGFQYARLLVIMDKLADALEVMDAISGSATLGYESIDFRIEYSRLLMRMSRFDDAFREINIAKNLDPEDETIISIYDEVVIARDKYNESRPPLEIAEVHFDTLFPTLQQAYANQPIGYVTIFNTKAVPVQNINLSLRIPKITLRDYELTIPSILANESKQVDLIVPITPEILSICRDTEQTLAAEIRITYVLDEPYTARQSKSIRALQNGAMNWNDRKQFACFINPGDEQLRNFVTSILNHYEKSTASNLPRMMASAIKVYDFYSSNGIKYVSDPIYSDAGTVEFDYVQFPFQTLSRKQGDCDDLLTLLAASYSVIGLNTALIDIPGHVMLAVDVAMSADDLINLGFDIKHFINRFNTLWLPMETTLLGKESFNKSWLSGIQRYDSIVEKGKLPDMIVFSRAHETYPAVTFSQIIATENFQKVSEALAMYQEDVKNLLLLSQIALEEQYQESIRRYPENLKIKNLYALWAVEQGKTVVAENLWKDVLKIQADNFTANTNLANLYLMQEKYDAARKLYLSALSQNLQLDNIHRNLCLLEYRAGNLEKARDYFNQIQDRAVLRRLNPSVYSALMNTGE